MTLVALVVLTTALASPPDGQGTVALVGLAVAALLTSAWHAGGGHDRITLSGVSVLAAASGDERCLRGAFRPQSRPDAPGRPRPRAPGGRVTPA